MLRSSGVRVARHLCGATQLLKINVRVGQAVSWQQCRFVNSRKGAGGHFEEEDIEEEDPMQFVPKPKIVSPDEMEFYDSMAYDDGYESGEDPEEVEQDQKDEEERQKVRDELDSRTGRLWSDPWEITDEEWSKFRTSDDLPDWTPDLCSRVSLERVQMYPDGIPTLSALARIPLPPPPPPHPGHEGKTKAYAKARKRQQYNYIAQQVRKQAEPKIDSIMKLTTWEDKQAAVDELFENVEFALRDQEQVLSKHPRFGDWVERALEDYLRSFQTEDGETKESETKDTGSDEVEESDGFPTAEQDDEAVPLFLDLYDNGSDMVPKILHPLKPHPHNGPGRMVEEWELSAHKKTKRIMLRQCARQVAQLLDSDSPVRVYVTGHVGVGKTATLATIVASARQSGSIVLYLPDGDRLRKNGFYVEPSQRREGMFDLPILSQEVCSEFLESHESDLEGMSVDSDTLSQFFAERDLKRFESPDAISLVELLQQGRDHSVLAPMCYSAVVHMLMNQSEKDFVIVADEFNCYYDHGHYFHMEYDEEVHKAIPCDKINLFEPFLNAMGLSTANEDEDAATATPVMMKRGGIVVGTTESHAVARKFTDALEASAKRAEAANDENAPLHVVDVPRFSALEVQHIISNFEATGIGRLRFDRGETVMNDQEVWYINMVAGGIGQNIIDECVM